MATVDSLDIQISASAQKANQSIDALVRKLDVLATSLGKINTGSITGLANGVNRLSTAMQGTKNVGTADFTRLAKNIERLGTINTESLNSAASSMSHLGRAFNNLGTVSANAVQVGELAKNLSKLGNKGVQNATTNIPQLAVAMRNLMQTLSDTPVVSQNVIQMTQALANLAAHGGRVGTASRTMTSGLNNTLNAMNRAKKSSLSLAAAFGKFYATWFLAIRGIKGFMKSVESTTDYIEAYNYYNVAFGKIASEWDKDFEKYGYQNAESYAESFTNRMNKTLGKLSGVQVNLDTGLLEETGLRNLGLNIQEITQYASQLASVTNSIGQTGEVSLAAAKSMTMLAGDISSLFNIDYSSVAQNLQSGLIGQSRALYKYGIDITNATLQTYEYNLGLEKSVSEMTQAEKMQLRMLAILDQSKVSWGDLANTISSPSNMLRQFKNNVKELGMVFGQLFIPVLQKVMPIINGVTIALKRLMVSFANILGIKIDFDAFGQGYSDLGDDIDDVSDSLDGVAKSAKKANAGLRAFDELKVINMPDESGKGAGAGAGDIMDLTQQILDATSEYEKVWNEAFAKMENTAQEWADRIDKILEPVKNIFKDFAVGDFFQAGQDVSALVVSITDFFARAIDNVDWYGIGKKIGDFLAGIDWLAVFKAAGNFIESLVNAAIDLWKGSFDAAPIETAIITAIAGLKFTGLGTGWFSTLSSKMSATIAGKNIGIVPTIAIAAVTWEIGFEIGKSLGDFLAKEGIIKDADFKNFTWFGKDGFFEKAFDDFGTTITAFKNMMTDYKENPVIAFITTALTAAATLFLGPVGFVSIIALFWDEITEMFSHGWDLVLEKWDESPIVRWFEKDITPWFSAEKWEKLWDSSTKGFKMGWNCVKAWWNESALIKWFENDVSPWFSGSTWEELWGYVKEDFEEGWDEIKKWWNKTAIVKWWNDDIKPWFTLKRWKELFSEVKNGFIDGWGSVKTWWEDTAIYKWWNENVTPWFSKERWSFSGIKDGLESAFNGAIKKIKEIWNSFAGWINDALSFDFDGFNKKFNVMGKNFQIGIPSFSVSLGKLPTFSNGGFPEDGWFRANHGEIMGRFDNGQSVVANNMQITEGISIAVQEGNRENNSLMKQEIELLKKQNDLLTGILRKEFGVTKTQIGEAAREYSVEYFRKTGEPAYQF